MIGTIERIKNSVLLKCSTLNDEMISKTLEKIVNTRIYRFSEEMVSLVGNLLTEEFLREKVSELIKHQIVKKIKRKLFIDSLALQITNDSFIEDYANKKISIEQLQKKYIKELENNKNSNQLNMTEDLNLSEIVNNLRIYVDEQIVPKVKENSFLATSVTNLVLELKDDLEKDLKNMIDEADNNYLNILIEELKKEIVEEEKEGEDNMFDEIKESNILNETNDSVSEKISDKFSKYDDMTLFNKVILSLNTAEEKLSRKEKKLENNKQEVEKRLNDTNKNIEANIERENKLSQRKLELNAKEVELNSKLSEAEVIFLNMKPLIKGLNKIKDATFKGGNENE